MGIHYYKNDLSKTNLPLMCSLIQEITSEYQINSKVQSSNMHCFMQTDDGSQYFVWHNLQRDRGLKFVVAYFLVISIKGKKSNNLSYFAKREMQFLWWEFKIWSYMRQDAEKFLNKIKGAYPCRIRKSMLQKFQV